MTLSSRRSTRGRQTALRLSSLSGSLMASVRCRHSDSGSRGDGDRDPHQSLDIENVTLLIGRSDHDRQATRTGAAGTADSMDVIFRFLGHIVVDDQRNVLNIDSARRDVGCHEDAVLARFETFESRAPLGKGTVGMDFRGRVAENSNRMGNLASAVSGSGENEDRALVGSEQVAKHSRLIVFIDDDQFLVDALCGRASRLYVHPRRVAQVSRGEIRDFLRHGGREEHRLPIRRDMAEDAVNSRGKAHIEHAIGFVENDDLGMLERSVALADMILQAAGRGDDNLHSAAKLILLLLHAFASDQESGVQSKLLENDGDLLREFTRRSEHQGHPVLRQPGSDGQRKG